MHTYTSSQTVTGPRANPGPRGPEKSRRFVRLERPRTFGGRTYTHNSIKNTYNTNSNTTNNNIANDYNTTTTTTTNNNANNDNNISKVEPRKLR